MKRTPPWDPLADEEWKEHNRFPGETQDSVTGETLDPRKVKEGCEEEMGFMKNMHVWDRVTRDQAQRDPEEQIVGARWVFAKHG